MRTRSLATLVALIVVLASNARAESPQAPVNEADALFREGRARMAAQDYTTACPLLAASFQKDPTTGTLLALAVCHERKGDLREALSEYHEVAHRSQAEARTDRENAARIRITAIEEQIARVTAPAAPVPTVEAPVCPAPVSTPAVTPTPVAPPAVVAVNAPTAAPESIADPPAAPVRRRARAFRPSTIDAPRASHDRAAASSDEGGMSFGQVSGLVLIGVGAFALGTAGAFTLEAISKNNDSNDGCVVNRCTEVGRNDRLDARSAGTAATITALIGGALATSGLVLYLLSDEAEVAPHRSTAAVAPWVGYRSFGAAAQGSF